MDQEEEYIILLLTIDLKEAFVRLVTRYVSELYGYAFHWTGNKEEAEDLVQVAFTKAYMALDRYSMERRRSLQLSAWLYTILKHLCYNYKRDKGQEKEIYFSKVDYEIEIDVQELPDYITEQKESDSEIAALISQLPPRYRDVLTLYYFNQYDYQEIADHLNMPIGTVKSCLSRGKEQLRKLLIIQRDEVQ